jgi:Uma2 family endonuclease
MEAAELAGPAWTAEAFLRTDQRDFGSAWRYELVAGLIVAHAAPSPDHGAIAGNLAYALGGALRRQQSTCRVEVGSGAAPKRQQNDTARIPDVSIRCGECPRLVFEIVSPSELRRWRQRDQRRRDLQDVEGIEEIIEVYQVEAAVHVYRRAGGGSWRFEAIDGLDAVLPLESVGIELRLADIYEGLSDLA